MATIDLLRQRKFLLIEDFDAMRTVLKGLLRDHLRVDEGVLATTVFPDSAGVAPIAGLVG